ncbi:NupC/NupG family nucleoside CNT transporter [Taibaiella helva]|uniref:NupC/NupG family nucleoside CNT transporter n=1 Tax=Taibaiella helva TaxID=2301235 RepID=UPI000E57BD91|nr:nucleoside transporter C-terminal domain-containing protein [Taibaiella helva]
MERFTGLIGIVLILGIAFLCSNNKRKINIRLVFSGLFLQTVIALLILKIEKVQQFFALLGRGMQKIEGFAKEGAAFVYGGIITQTGSHGNVPYRTVIERDNPFVFGFSVTAAIILVCVLVAIFYHIGLMQRIVSLIARGMNFVMRVSGAEALSNVASAFVGQVEAQVMIRPYLKGMTKSELLASMSGSLACIAGGILIVYANMGAQAGLNLAPKLIMASLMAAPGALVISKIVFPETEESQTMGKVKLEVKSEYTNLIDAISHAAADGFKIAMNVIAMLIGFIALIALVDWSLLKLGHLFNPDLNLSLNWVFGKLFYPFAWSMGVPSEDVGNAATLLGQKLTVNEFLAFKSLTSKEVPIMTEKGLLIVTTAICGFANFSSVGMQIGGIGALAPERREDLAKLGLRALLCGTLASYLSASIAGILM